MDTSRALRIVVISATVAFSRASLAGGDPGWYVGVWDSTIYNRSERPRTVAVRIEVSDAETGLPVPRASVSLRGHYLEERIGPASGRFEPYEPQTREFELTTETARDGVVVFALGWQKTYPWDMGRPEPKVNERGVVEYSDVHSTWIRPVDDVEKVQELRVRHPDYKALDEAFDFYHMLQVGQDRTSQLQEPRVFEKFEAAWKKEITAPGVKFCVLDLGLRFGGFEKKNTTQSEFFERIRDKNFGTVYREPHNWFSRGEHPQSECGPYFVYLLEIRLARRSGAVDVNINRQGRTGDRGDDARGERPREGPERSPGSRQDDDRERENRRAAEAKEQERQQREREEAEHRRMEEDRAREARQRALVEKAQRHPLGVAVEVLTDGLRREIGLYPGTQGLLVRYVQPSSAADNAGLRVGVVIEAVDQRAVSSESDLESRLRGKRAGDQFVVGIWHKEASGKWERASSVVRLPR
ncbi:MAG: PDZ domain-containing protein [Planctomycetota bacterium]